MHDIINKEAQTTCQGREPKLIKASGRLSVSIGFRAGLGCRELSEGAAAAWHPRCPLDIVAASSPQGLETSCIGILSISVRKYCHFLHCGW